MDIDKGTTDFSTPIEALLSSVSIDPVWFAWVDHWVRSDDHYVRVSALAAVTLSYGVH